MSGEHHIYDCATGALHVVADDDPEIHAAEVHRIEGEAAVWRAEQEDARQRVIAELAAAHQEAQARDAARARRRAELLAQLAKHPDPLLRQLAEVL